MANQRIPTASGYIEPVQRPWPRYRPGNDAAIEPGLVEAVEPLDRAGRLRSAMDEIFKVLDRDPANQHALRLAMFIVGRSRTRQLQAVEPLTPAYRHDRRLDPIFAACDRCGTEWVPHGLFLQNTVVTNAIGKQCKACDLTLCRDCLPSAQDDAAIATACPRCGQLAMSDKVLPTGRAPRQMARHTGRVTDGFVFREGPIAPDEPTMRALFEDISPDVLEDGAILHGVSRFPWPENIVWHAWRYVENLASTGQLRPEALQLKESVQVSDSDGNRIFMIKLIGHR